VVKPATEDVNAGYFLAFSPAKLTTKSAPHLITGELIMKHFFLILVLIIAGYGLWQVADRTERSLVLKQITRHGIRLLAVLLVLVALLLLATQFTSTSII
jgi:hypothetical protein